LQLSEARFSPADRFQATIASEAYLMDKCGGCGLVVSGGAEACRALFDQIAAPIPGGTPLLPFRRLVVDTYALQHPDPFCVSATSLAAHLTGVGWILEYRGSATSGSDQIRRWLNSRPALVKPALPASYGDVRIDAIAEVSARGAVEAAVDRWARSTWAAYAPLHPIAREWIAHALAYRGHAR
jgi:hypothetical protein